VQEVKFEHVKQFLGHPLTQTVPFKENPSQQLVQLLGLSALEQVLQVWLQATQRFADDKKLFV
jgi:hypothetical protein